MPALKVLATTKLTSNVWTPVDGASFTAEQGMDFTEFRGQFWGVFVNTDPSRYQQFYSLRLADGKFEYPYGVAATAAAAADEVLFLCKYRVSVTVLDDIYYNAWIDPNGKMWVASTPTPYLGKSFSFSNGFTNGGPSSWKTSPAICAFGGDLVLVGVGIDSKIYYTRLSADRTQITAWEWISDFSSDLGPDLCVYKGELYMTHLGTWHNTFYTVKLPKRGGSWEWGAPRFEFSGITQSPRLAVPSGGNLTMVSRNSQGNVQCFSLGSDGKWSSLYTVNNATAFAAVGVGSFNGNVYISYASNNTRSIEKTGLEVEEEAVEDISEKESALVDNSEKEGAVLPQAFARERRWPQKFLCKK